MKRRHLTLAGLVVLLVGAAWPRPPLDGVSASSPWPVLLNEPGTFSVMTYNVKGLPWPAASGRQAALAKIGSHLAALRAQGAHPRILLLQEAFTNDAKAIAASAGYRFIAAGPTARTARLPAILRDDPGRSGEASLLKGETIGHWADSGLMILSDYPIEKNVQRIFPEGTCAGYDCLAAKGVQLAWIRIPGQAAPLAVVNTHLNSRRASGVSLARANHAFALQLSAVRRFVDRQVPRDAGVIVAGDFNIGRDPARTRYARRIGGPLPRAIDVLDQALSDGLAAPASRADARTIQVTGKDKQYFRRGSRLALKIEQVGVPFGSRADVAGLSDHMGFTTIYQTR